MSSNNKEKEKTRGKDEEKEGKKKKKSSSSSSRSRSSKKEDAPDASAPSAHSDRFVLEDSVLLGPQAISLRKYRSVQTGMIIYVSDNVMGPIVHWHIALATETHDEAGLPHTLEHLVFLGSEQYPYKGVLDSIANRCLAQGTNAWTLTDHTAYTISCIGLEGFLQVLPVYMDHVLYPTLTDEAFHTEVYHVNGKGEDAGVVYCEMQALENKAVTLVQHAIDQTLYDTSSGYRHETGGILKDIRELTAKRVRDYHAQYYRPDNLCLIISGMFRGNDDKIFSTIEKIEENILKKPSKPKMERPWQTPLAPFARSSDIAMTYPADKDAPALVSLAWRGPNVNDHASIVALNVLNEYLSDSSVSPLQKSLVYADNAYCGELDFSSTDSLETVWALDCVNVPIERAREVKKAVFKTLSRVIEKGIKMDRMEAIIERLQSTFVANLEEDVAEYIAEKAITHFLYSTSKDLRAALDDQRHLAKLVDKPESYWIELLKKYYVDAPCCTVVATPDPQRSVDLASEDDKRTAARKETLGKKGLKELKQRLTVCKTQNDRPVPREVISQFRVPDVSHINFIPVTTIRNGLPLVKDDLSQKVLERVERVAGAIPFFIQFDHLQTAFTQVRLFLDSSALDDGLRKWIELYFEIIFEMPMMRKGKRWGHKEVVEAWSDWALEYSSEVGFGGSSDFSTGSYAQLLVIDMQCEVNRYVDLVELLSDTFTAPLFESNRIKQGIARLQKSVKKRKQDAGKILSAVVDRRVFKPCSNINAVQVFEQSKFLQEQLELLGSAPDKVIARLNELVKALFTPGNMRVQVSADLLKENDIAWKKPWLSFCPNQAPLVNLSRPTLSYSLKNSNAFNSEPKIVGMSSVESSYMHLVAEGPIFGDADVAALAVIEEYLTGVEGPIWREIRGRGLSYGADLYSSLEKGLIYFVLKKSSAVADAYEATKQILEKAAGAWDEAALEGCKSAVLFSLVEDIGTAPLAAADAMLTYLSNTSTPELIRQVLTITPADLDRVLQSRLLALFDQSKTLLVIVTNPKKVDRISKQFEELKVSLKEISSLEDYLTTK